MQKRLRKPRRGKARVAKGTILPHKERELDLMLKGAKPLARFVRDHGTGDHANVEAAFAPHVERGDVLRFAFRSENSERIYYCLPTEEWRVKLLELVHSTLEAGAHAFTIYDLHRLEGALLGYSKEDVEFFIARWRKQEAAGSRTKQRA